MPKVKETKGANKKIKDLGLWEEYKSAKKTFIENPKQKSIDLCKWDKRNGIWAFKITKKVRVKFVKDENGDYIVYDAGDFHRKQAKK